MPFEEVKKIWMNGRRVDFADAKIHVLTHAIHYGSGLFEGIRCYNTRNQGPAIFHLDDHARRLYDSAKIYRMEIPFAPDEFKRTCIDTVGIALDVNGYVSEGSGENFFVVRDGRIMTQPLGASILAGITRASVLKIARELGLEVVETLIQREMLYVADEVFFSGPAAEVT